MSVERDLADLSEVVRDQVAQGIARDLAIKFLAGVVSQMIDEDRFQEVVHGHIMAIQRLEGDSGSDAEMNDKIATHFHQLLVEPPEDGGN